MKKIFGLMLLLATVAFTSQASETADMDAPSIVCDIGSDSPDLISPSVEVYSPDFIYVADEPVSCTSEGGLILESIPIDSTLSSYKSNLSDEPLKYLSDLTEPLPNTSDTGEPTFKNGYECPDLTKDIATNVGKLKTTFS